MSDPITVCELHAALTVLIEQGAGLLPIYEGAAQDITPFNSTAQFSLATTSGTRARSDG